MEKSQQPSVVLTSISRLLYSHGEAGIQEIQGSVNSTHGGNNVRQAVLYKLPASSETIVVLIPEGRIVH